MVTLLLDNYDSFSHILFHHLWEVNGERPLFIRNDEWTLERIREARFDNIVISPGPGHPGEERDFGICAAVIAAFPDRPILGVCLGHQGLGLSAGANVIHAPRVRHGKVSAIRHDGKGLFRGLPGDFPAMRYHSLVIDPSARMRDFDVAATAVDDGQIMAVRGREKPFHGVQFHPESIATGHGMALLDNFRDLSERWLRGRRAMGAERPPVAAQEPDPPMKPVPPDARLSGPGQVTRMFPWRDPEAVFARFFKEGSASFWLDSLAEPVPGEKGLTCMGSGPRLFEFRGRSARLLEEDGFGGGYREVSAVEADPFAYLDSLLGPGETCKLREASGIPGSPEWPEPAGKPGAFRGGLVGWFGYGLKDWCDGGTPAQPDPGGLPAAVFLEPDRILVFDSDAREVSAILPVHPAAGSETVPRAEALAWLDSLASQWDSIPDSELHLRRISEAGGEPPAPAAGGDLRVPAAGRKAVSFRLPWRLSLSREEYLFRIRGLQTAIHRGDTYEACLTNEISVRSATPPFETYRRLRRTNPAPYAAFLRFPQAAVLSASPERFLKLDACGNLVCRPIKGTRPRGLSPAEDEALKSDLAGNAKDRSENLMIVDLVRNDFARVCVPGSVRAPELMRVEAHPAVLQLVSTVTGKLAPGRRAVDAVRACFPGGSMTGAPKIRTMRLLEEAEGRERGIFSGGLGYLGWDGAMDLGMVIRTLVHRDGEYRVGCGGAILAESDPESEFAEAMLKAAAPMAALELAETGEGGGWQTLP